MADDSKGEHIGNVGYDNLPPRGLEYLRGYISRRAALFINQVLLAQPAGKTEVSYNIVLAFIMVDSHHDVLKLEVSMNDPLLTQMI